jgi:PAS domain S-box-containing protein
MTGSRHADAADRGRSGGRGDRDPLPAGETDDLRLRESEARYRYLADAMPQLAWTATAAGVPDYYNARAAEYAGLEQNRDGSWTWQPVLHPDDVGATSAAWQHAVETGEPYEIEHRVRMRDGTYRWHISRSIPGRDADGTLRWYGTATDIHATHMAREAARASEERLQRAMLVADIGIFEHDHDTDTIYWSPTLRAFHGLPPDGDVTLEQAIGLVHPDDRDMVAAAIARAHDPDGDGTYDLDYRIVRRDGSEGWITVNSRTFFEAEGGVRRPRRTIGAMADISARKAAEVRLRESEERLRLATEVASLGTYDIDVVNESTFWSPTLRAILGVGAEDPVAAPADLVHPDDLPAVRAAFMAATDPAGPGMYRVEHRIRRATGEVRWVVDQARTLFEGDGPERRARRVIGAVVDITERKHGEELRDAFIGMLSHELRTPVTSIYGGSQVLRRPGLDEGLRREILEGVIEESERLARLVENLLVIAKVERSAELGEREPILVRPIISRIAATARREHPDRRIVVPQSADTPTVLGDEGAVELVLRNLLSNAIKYGSPDGPITIATETEGRSVCVRVLDTGPGLQVEDSSRLFELFYRVPAVRLTAAGAGIGLYVTRALVRAMGGRVWAEDRPEGGAEFGFALPTIDGSGDHGEDAPD